MELFVDLKEHVGQKEGYSITAQSYIDKSQLARH